MFSSTSVSKGGRGVFVALFAFFLATGFAATSLAGIVIDSAEVGVAKFHRKDNKEHPYGANNAWSPFILPDGAPSNKLLVRKNADGSYSVFYNTLTELLATIVDISKKEHQKISVINVHGHGLPGAMWFPANDKMLQSSDCSDWRQAASGSDDANYDQYYSPVPAYEVEEIRQMSNIEGSAMVGCTTGLPEWQQEVAANPAVLDAVDPNVQIHFLSCVVGLGTVGQEFTAGIAKLFVRGEKGRVETSMDFGLGDWSMPEGMGFWDYITDAQLNHDNSIYPVDRKDREIMQKGTVRVAEFNGTNVTTGELPNQDFLRLGYDPNAVTLMPNVSTNNKIDEFMGVQPAPLPAYVHIPGTAAYEPVRAR